VEEVGTAAFVGGVVTAFWGKEHHAHEAGRAGENRRVKPKGRTFPIPEGHQLEAHLPPGAPTVIGRMVAML